MIPTIGGEDEFRVSMSGVVLSQRDEARHWKRNKTIFGSLTTVNVDKHSLGIDIGYF